MFSFDTKSVGRTDRPRRSGARLLASSGLAAAAMLAASSWAGAAAAQASVTTLTEGSATIFQPISISKVQDLQFGIIVRPVSGSGSVTQPAGGGSRTTSGPINLLTGATYGAPQPATFNVLGEGGQAFSIGVPPSTTLNKSGADPLTVTLASSAASGTLSNTLGNQGSATFGVGGTILNITDLTSTGIYTGSFIVTVSYN